MPNGHGTISRLSLQRIGPLTGPSDFGTQNLSPLQDTTVWGVRAVDEGVSVVYNGRTFIYFGDVWPVPGDESQNNMDLIAWVGDLAVLRHGGHSAQGWTFYLPNDQQGATAGTGQPDWRFCTKCSALFWCPFDQPAGKCPYDDGQHTAQGWNFYLPNTQQGATARTGQEGWRYCGQCNGLCWAPNGTPVGTCPAGGQHSPIGWIFVLPNNMQGATASTGQDNWRFCHYCSALFFDGYGAKGVCPGAPGGGLRLNPVLQSGSSNFYGFNGRPPVGYTLLLERPGGAFVCEDQMYVFANVSSWHYSRQHRDGNPQVGTYLLSTGTPDQPTSLTTQYLVSPRIGKCTLPDGTVRSHQPTGFDFFLPYSASAAPNWRYCTSCESLFFSAAGNAGHCFGNAAGHTPAGDLYVPVAGPTEDVEHQSNWRCCSNCLTMVYDGYSTKGNCPAGGTHTASGATFSIAHIEPNLVEGDTKQPDWRFCAKCAGLFWADSSNLCPAGGPHIPLGVDFCLTHDITNPSPTQQDNWRFCPQCGGLFWNGSTSRCPAGGTHQEGASPGIVFTPIPPDTNPNYVLDHDIPTDAAHQDGWRYCTQCAGIFWSGASTTICPAGGGHSAAGYNFVLPFNPVDDGSTIQGGWRYCARCQALTWTGQEDTIGAATPYVVNLTDHPELPSPPADARVAFSDQAAVLISYRFGGGPHKAGFSLACWPLPTGAVPRLQDIQYYDPASKTWTADVRQLTTNLFDYPETGYTETGLLWLPGPQLWMMTYTHAQPNQGSELADATARHQPIVARFANQITELANETDVVLFDPNPLKDNALGVYMDVDTNSQTKAYAYGPYPLQLYTTWDAENRILDLYFLASLFNPYQVQVMNAQIAIAAG